MAAELLDEACEPGLCEELGGVGRHLAHREDVQGVALYVVDDEALPVVGLGVEVVGDALPGLAGQAAQRALAKVEVERYHALALYSEGGGEVGRYEGLAGSDIE